MKGGRVVWVDLLRGLAVVLMVEVHTVNALLDPAWRQRTVWAAVDFAGGLVAPAFLFVSGFAFLLAIESRRASLLALRPPLAGILGRIGLIWLVGYLLHLPAYTLREWQQRVTAEQWQAFVGVDVLHCIAGGLLLLLLLRLAVPGRRPLLIAIGLIGAAAVLLAGPVWQANFPARLPPWLAAYLAPTGSTLFSLLPWFGFMAAGGVAGLLYLQAREAGSEARWARTVLRVGLALGPPGVALLVLLRDHLQLIVDERPSPLFFLCRLGFVLVFLVLCRAMANSRLVTHPLVAWPARESLLIYWLHLKLLYHPLPGGRSLVGLIGPALGPAGCLLVIAGLLLVLLVPAVLWHRVKALHPLVGPRVVQGLLAGGLVLFLIA